MAPLRSAGNTISVPPSPNRRVAAMPRASRIWAKQLGQQDTTRRTASSRRRPDGRLARAQPDGACARASGEATRPSAHTARRRRGRAHECRPAAAARGSAASATYGVAGDATSASGRSTCASRPWCSTATRSASSAASCRSWVTSSADSPDAAAQVEEHRLEVAAGDGVERTERLVEQQRAGAGGQRPGEGDALTLAARQLVRPARGELRRRQPDERPGPRRGVAGSRLRPWSSHGTSATLRDTLQCGSRPPSCGT